MIVWDFKPSYMEKIKPKIKRCQANSFEDGKRIKLPNYLRQEETKYPTETKQKSTMNPTHERT